MTRTEAKAAFDKACTEAAQLLTQAARLAVVNSLSDIDIAKADAAAGLAGADFHKISIHGADPQDFELLEIDMHLIARTLSPLIEAIGMEAQQNSRSVFDLSGFLDVCAVGMESAISELRYAQGRAVEDLPEAV